MPATFDFIATATPTSAAFSFTSIPQNYTDLVLMVNARVTSAWDIVAMQPLGSPSGYSGTYIEGSGNTGGFGTSEISFRMGYIPGTSQSNVWSADQVNIFNYASTTRFKTVYSTSRYPNVQGSQQGFSTQWKVGLWQNTSAITSLTIGTANGGSFASGTNITLYGIAKA